MALLSAVPVLVGVLMMMGARLAARLRGRFKRTRHAIDPYAYGLILAAGLGSLFVLRSGLGTIGLLAAVLVAAECLSSGRMRSIAPRIRREVADGGWVLTEATVVDGLLFSAGTRLMLARGAVIGGNVTDPMRLQGVEVQGLFEVDDDGELSRFTPTRDTPVFSFLGREGVALAGTEVRTSPLRCFIAKPLSLRRVEVPARSSVTVDDDRLVIASKDGIEVDGQLVPPETEVAVARRWFSSEVDVTYAAQGYRDAPK